MFYLYVLVLLFTIFGLIIYSFILLNQLEEKLKELAKKFDKMDERDKKIINKKNPL